MTGLVVDQARVGRHLGLELVRGEQVEHRQLRSGAGQVAERVEVAGVHEVADEEQRAAAAHPDAYARAADASPGEALGARLGQEAEQLERPPLAAQRPHRLDACRHRGTRR